MPSMYELEAGTTANTSHLYTIYLHCNLIVNTSPHMIRLQQFEENNYYTSEELNDNFLKTQQQEATGEMYSESIEPIMQ